MLLKMLGLKGLYRFARAMGTVEWAINYKRRRRFRRSLEQVLQERPSPRDRRRFTRAHFMQTRCDKIFYLVFDCIPRDRAKSLFSIGNKALLDEAIGPGRGVYVAMSHHGTIHVAGLLMALSGYRVAGVRERNESGLRRFVQSRLDRKHPDFHRARIIFADAFPREIFRCLKDGFLIGSMMDVRRKHHPNQRTETVTVFGEDRQFLSGPMRVALRSRVATLQGFVVPDRDFRYSLEIVDYLLRPDAAGDEDALVAEAMRLYATNVERFVRATPHLLSRI